MKDRLHKRTGFYPVSARDYLEPLRLLKGWVDDLVFCDINCMPRNTKELSCLRRIADQEALPNACFFLGDALAAMTILKPVDLFFLRRDSDGEGGSGLNLLGAERLPMALDMIKPNGLLVTDRSNGRDWFYEFQVGNRSRICIGDRELQLAEQQPWIDKKLLSFSVR